MQRGTDCRGLDRSGTCSGCSCCAAGSAPLGSSYPEPAGSARAGGSAGSPPPARRTAAGAECPARPPVAPGGA